MTVLTELTEKIQQWIIDRNIHKGSDAKAQYVKLMEEAGELAASISRGKSIKDDIGDMYVVMCAICLIEGVSIEDCIETAYNDIKDRKGKMINGAFIKESDLSKIIT